MRPGYGHPGDFAHGLSASNGASRRSNWLSAHGPLDFELEYEDILDWYGVPQSHRAELLDCVDDARLDGTEASALRPFARQTPSIDDFKALIGVPDHYIESGKAIAPAPLGVAYDPKLEGPEPLNPEELHGLLRAAGNYLFGPSAAVAEFRTAIEARLAPFELAVYAVRRLRLRSTGSLTVSGLPAVLIAKEVEIDDGGGLVFETVTRVLSDRMIKVMPGQFSSSSSSSAEVMTWQTTSQ